MERRAVGIAVGRWLRTLVCLLLVGIGLPLLVWGHWALFRALGAVAVALGASAFALQIQGLS